MRRGQSPNEPLEIRFGRFVVRGEPDACWEWRGTRVSGYGTFSVRLKSEKAHRVAFVLAHGLTLSDIDGRCVLHSCDNPPCVNPAHLRLGTPADNAADRDSRQRRRPPQGVQHGMAKLTEADVVRIRAAYRGRYGDLKRLGDQFGITPAGVLRVVKRQCWRHVA